MPSCSCASAALHPATCHSHQTLQADQPGFLFQASLPLLCPCFLAWVVLICLDRVVEAFLVVVVMLVTFQSLTLFDCEAGHAIV
jgi:hypothetical protein